MSSKYLQSIQEVREWLSYKKLDEFIYILLDNGYDDLSAIALSNNEEMIELEKLFADGETRKAIHVLVESLRSIGIDAYRKQKNDFRRLTTTVYENEQNPTSSMAWNSSEQKAIETRKNRFSSAVKPAHAYAHVNKEGYLSIRVGGDSGSWSDKFVVVKGTELKIYSSRRDMINSELSLNLLGAVTNVTKPDLTTLIISTNLSNAKKIELQCSNKMEHQEWFEAFTALQVKNDPNNLSPPSNPAKMEKRGSISGKRACAVEDCNLSAFGKGPYCSQHQNQYRRGSSSQKKESELSPESKSTPELKTSMLETKSVFETKPLPDKPFMSPPVKELPAVPIASPKVSGLSQALANSGRATQQKPTLPSRPAGEPSNMNGINDKRLPSPALAAVALAAKSTYPPASPQGAGQGFMNAAVAPAVAFTPISIIDEIIEDDKRFDRSSYEGVIAAVARIRARQALSLCVWDPIDENELERRLRGRGENVHEKKVKTYLKLLAEGALFKKYKHGNSSKRLIWCTPLFDYVIWSDEEKQTVKGFIKTSEIQEINQGFGKNKCRLYIVSSGRTLELEAKDAAMAKEWKGLFEFLIQSNMNELEARNEFKQRESFGTLVNTVRMEYKKLLEEGDVFKKWPGKKIIQKGGFQHRKINCDDRVERLQWAEIETGKLKGFILFDDIVCVEEDPNDKLKFTIFAMDRSLDLEAKSVWVRQKWLRALRFFIEFKRTK